MKPLLPPKVSRNTCDTYAHHVVRDYSKEFSFCGLFRQSGRCAKYLLVCLVWWVFSSTLYAQTTTNVTGVVTDASGSALVGVSVTVPGTTVGVSSDVNGRFSIRIPDGATQVKFTYIGYQTQVVAINGKPTIDVTMEEGNEMDEVVVVGFGAQKKATLTGAIATVGDRVFADRGVVTTPAQALQGQVPGLVVTRGSTAPGREEWKYQIRGNASVNDMSPLVLIDGVPGGMNDINPDDIENISVLKDGSAAIFGSRAGAGVILITTKRGKVQKARVTYKTNVAIKTPSMQQAFMNMQQWAYSIEEAALNDNALGTVYLPGSPVGAMPYWALQAMKTGDPRYINTVQPYLVGPKPAEIHDIGFLDYNMNDETWGNALSQSHDIVIQGGTEFNRYNISFGYMNDQSPLRRRWGNDQSDRYNVRVNNDLTFNKRFELATDLSFDRAESTFPTQRPSAIAGNPPGSPLLTPEGRPYGWANNYTPIVATKFGGQKTTAVNSFRLNVAPQFHLAEGLDLKGNIFFNPWDTNDHTYQDKVQWYDWSEQPYQMFQPNRSYVNREAKTVMKQLYQGYLNYKRTFAQKHNVEVMAGASYEKEKATRFWTEASDILVPEIHSLNTATKIDKSNDEVRAWAMASYFSRVTYNYEGKYMAELLGRYDGTSRFVSGKRWSPFFGASAGWRVSEESFMQANGIFDNLKLRASYGEIGNQAGIDNYDYIALLNVNSASGITAGQPLFGSESAPVYGQTITQKNMVSLDRSWETIRTTNVGVDFTVLKSRLSGSFDVFYKKNDNMLVSVTYPQVLGATAPKTNSGSMEVRGWEFALDWKDKIGKVNYFVSGNISNNESKLLDMENATVKEWNKRTDNLVGYATNTYWGMEANKLIENTTELSEYRKVMDPNLINPALLRVGDMMYNDLDGDGKVTKNDVKLLGDNAPHYSFGLNMGAEYAGFDFTIMIQGVGNQTIVRNMNAATILVANSYQNQGSVWYGKNWSDVALTYGRDYALAFQDNNGDMVNSKLLLAPLNLDPNGVPKTTLEGNLRGYNYLYSDAWYRAQNGAYARVKNIIIGYTLPHTLTTKFGVDRLRVYFSGGDLFEISMTKDGWDPESRAEDPFGGTSGANAYPFMRSYAFGLDLTF